MFSQLNMSWRMGQTDKTREKKGGAVLGNQVCFSAYISFFVHPHTTIQEILDCFHLIAL
jgi:hypothetical protein